MSNPCTKGFTLIELLVAVAIVAALAVLLIPSLSSTIAASTETRCLNNLRQLGAAGIAYAADNNSLLPDRTLWATATETPKSLVPYVGLHFRAATTAPSAKP